MRHPLIWSVSALLLLAACESVPDEAAELDAAGAASAPPAEQLVEINVERLSEDTKKSIEDQL